MKKILVIAAVLVVLILANLVYNHLEKSSGNERDKQRGTESGEKDKPAAPGSFNVADLRKGLDKREETYKIRTNFCSRAVDRMFKKGRNINILEFRQLAKVQKMESLRDYYSCKAVEDLNPRWCEPLKWFENDIRPEHQYEYCMKSYKAKSILRYLMIDSRNRMTIDEFDRALRDRECPFREKMVENARLIMSDDLADCDRVDETFIGKFHCLIIKTGKMPETGGDDRELNQYAGALPLMMRAIKEKDPQIIQEYEGRDNKLTFLGLFSEEPFCDAAFGQVLKMQCQSY